MCEVKVICEEQAMDDTVSILKVGILRFKQ